jgi:protocatechuate 3,4-dioxygenase beta subunit
MCHGALAFVVLLAVCMQTTSAPSQQTPAKEGERTVELELGRVPRGDVCAATVRHALKLPGVTKVDVTPGKRLFSVTYDPRQITADRMLEVLAKASEAAAFAPTKTPQDVEYVEALLRAQKDRPPRLQSAARIATASEPGTPLVVRGRVFAEDGRTPVAGAVVFAYHTDRDGVYDRREAGAHSWRLRGWAQTDAEGGFEFTTIRPGAYPSRRQPAHVHLAAFTTRARYHAGEVLFADDALLTAADRETSKLAGDFGTVRPVHRDAGTEHVDIQLRLEPDRRF